MSKETEHFIKNIEIKNFKCFDNFKAEGFGRVNLIGGKNNVGKTAFMEACYVNVHSMNTKQFTYATYCLKMVREKINILMKHTGNYRDKFMEQSNQIFTSSNINKSFFKIEEKDSIKRYFFHLNSKEILVNFKDFSFEIEIIPNVVFIDNFGLSSNDVIQHYSAIQKKDEETYLNKLICKFDSNITAFKIIDEKPQCKVNNKYLELTEFGDGVRHLISIVSSLYTSENGHLFIDELDNGIHYTMLDELWEIVLKVSKELNVQVFATTHSKECIESYARVAKKLEDEEKIKKEDIKFLSLYRNKENELKSITFDYEKIQDRIELGLDNR